MFDDIALATRILPEAAKLSLTSLSVDMLGDIPPGALHKLVSTYGS